jgi:hypothetical protein
MFYHGRGRLHNWETSEYIFRVLLWDADYLYRPRRRGGRLEPGRTTGTDSLAVGTVVTGGAANLEVAAGTHSESLQAWTPFRVIIVWFVPSFTSAHSAAQSRRAALDTPRARATMSMSSVVRVQHRHAIKEASTPWFVFCSAATLPLPTQDFARHQVSPALILLVPSTLPLTRL